MTFNMEILFNQIKKIIETKYKDRMPTEDQIYAEADQLRSAFANIYPLSDDEYAVVKRMLPENILHSIGYADTLRLRDSNHKVGWYLRQDNGDFFWNRYREYLGNKWGPEVIERLHQTTTSIMDDLGDPNVDDPFQRRGLLLGDVQSGKTATYTAICNKATDVGYKVIIVLAGLMENLRVQTQERLDAEFVGLDSKYDLDKKADISQRNIKVGVGRIQPSATDKHITRFTSVTTDFKASILKSLGLNLNDLNGTALFVVKKNKNILNNLKKWITKDEDVLNLPLLLIDDEADNASVNTAAGDDERTAINDAINKILRSFKQATYLGITATPFANIFITPETENDGAAKDLFPKDFLTLLPAPDRYIGADKIFGNGDADDWFATVEGVGIPKDPTKNRHNAEFMGSILSIDNIEQESFFRYKHKKELAEELNDLPFSLIEAVRYFVLATAITDIRFDINEHRSMLVNVSRFTDVQNATADLLTDFLEKMVSAIENYSQLPINKAMEITEIKELNFVWEKYDLARISGKQWEVVLRDYLTKAAKRIVIRSVNQKTGAKSLDYFNYKGTGMRVIAVGGNSLSRGLTLEGLCVSYFYRNTMMYDTLLQMGRWFGYRENYRDLFKIWMGEDSIAWYCYITDAFNELKEELRTMARQNQTPEEFGLKVRQAPASLIVTARNKMRSGTTVDVPITLSKRLIETPRLWDDIDIIKDNNTLCEEIVKKAADLPDVSYRIDDYVNAHIWSNVPRSIIIELVSQYQAHPWSLNFNAVAISDMIAATPSLERWDIAIPVGSDDENYELKLNDGTPLLLHGENRKIKPDGSARKMLRVNDHHVRVGAGGCTKIGLDRKRIEVLRVADGGKATDKTYLVEDRAPIAMIHLMKKTNEELMGYPKYIYAIGLGFPGGNDEKKAKYVVNTTELKNYADIDMLEGDGDVIQ